MNLFAKTNYPKQALDPKILEVLDSLDSQLVAGSSACIPDASMVVKFAEISMFYSVKSVDAIVAAVLTTVPETYFYIPRSIAFFIDEQGSWCFSIAVREVGSMTPLEVKYFTQMLGRTNDARTK